MEPFLWDLRLPFDTTLDEALDELEALNELGAWVAGAAWAPQLMKE